MVREEYRHRRIQHSLSFPRRHERRPSTVVVGMEKVRHDDDRKGVQRNAECGDDEVVCLPEIHQIEI